MTQYNFPETFVGDTIILEKLEQLHSEDLYKAIEESREHIAKWLSWLTPEYKHKDVEDFIEIKEEEFLERKAFPYVIIDKETEEVLGSIEIFKRNEGRVELGYYLMEKSVGQGVMTQALDLLKDFCFNETPTIRIDLYTLEDNEKSMMVAKRNGFAFEGVHYHQQLDLDGSVINAHRFALVKDEAVMKQMLNLEPELINIYNVKCLKSK